MRRLEAKRYRRVAAGGGGIALLRINVISQVVLALVFKSAADTVRAVDDIIDTSCKRFAIGVGRARKRETCGIQLITERGVIAGRGQGSKNPGLDHRVNAGWWSTGESGSQGKNISRAHYAR